MARIRSFYFPDGRGEARNRPVPAQMPVYVMFVTDGGTGDKARSEQQVRWAAYEPIFWQFMAIGRTKKAVKGRGPKGALSRMVGQDFSFLEKLDDMSGRFVDNAGFFSVEDPEDLSDGELYDLLMSEYPRWVSLVRNLGLLSA